MIFQSTGVQFPALTATNCISTSGELCPLLASWPPQAPDMQVVRRPNTYVHKIKKEFLSGLESWLSINLRTLAALEPDPWFDPSTHKEAHNHL